MTTAAATRMAIPGKVGPGSLYPSKTMTEVVTTHAASANSNTPAIRIAPRSACSWAALTFEPPEHDYCRCEFDGTVSTEGE
jgi:hypothetical protein